MLSLGHQLLETHSLPRSEWFIGLTKFIQNLNLQQLFTALHKSLFTFQLSLSSLPLVFALCWKPLTLKRSRRHASAHVPNCCPPLQLPQEVTPMGTRPSCRPAADLERDWHILLAQVWLGNLVQRLFFVA